MSDKYCKHGQPEGAPCDECAAKQEGVSSFAAPAGSAENIRLPNDTKIRFCNAIDALRRHGIDCRDCATYIKWGDGDLCAKGKDLIARELAYADTKIEFPPNDKMSHE